MAETNYEHFKDEIMKMGLLTPADACRFKKKNIHKTDSCAGFGCDKCDVMVKKWLDEQYKEPVIEIDWEKVPVDTPVYVSDYNKTPNSNDAHRYFKEFRKDLSIMFFCFDNGKTSFSYDPKVSATSWKYCSLARPEDIEKYKKV